MNVEDFKALKLRLVTRARQLIETLGKEMKGTNGPIRYYTMGRCRVVEYNRHHQLFIQAPHKNYLTGDWTWSKIYDEHNGVEVPLGMTHLELVRSYNDALAQIDRALLLEDLARV